MIPECRNINNIINKRSLIKEIEDNKLEKINIKYIYSGFNNNQELYLKLYEI